MEPSTERHSLTPAHPIASREPREGTDMTAVDPTLRIEVSL